jgi:ribosomal protein S27AE
MRYGTKEDRARHAIRNAVRDGKVVKPDRCERCGLQVPLQAHHDDHDRPLDVRWYCSPYHGLEHRKHQGPTELQSLRDENARLRAALQPFAGIALAQDGDKRAKDMIDAPDLSITPDDVRRARKELGINI